MKTKKKDSSLIIEHLLEIAYSKNYRKRNGIVYEEHIVYTDDACRYGSRFWKPAKWGGQREDVESESSILHFYHHYCSKDLYPEIAILTTDNPQKTKSIVDQLINCKTSDFKEVIPSRNLLSFKNGIYNTESGTLGTFHPWGPSTEEFDSQATANFIDLEFPEDLYLESGVLGGANWMRIPTPHFQSYLLYIQQLTNISTYILNIYLLLLIIR